MNALYSMVSTSFASNPLKRPAIPPTALNLAFARMMIDSSCSYGPFERNRNLFYTLEVSACILTLTVRIGYVATVAKNLLIADIMKILMAGILLYSLYLRSAGKSSRSRIANGMQPST